MGIITALPRITRKLWPIPLFFFWQCEENEEHGEVDYVVWFWWTLSSFWFHVHVNVWWWRQHAGDNASGLSCLESDPNSFQMFFVVLRFIFRPHVQTGSCWLVTLQFLPSGGLVNCSPHMFVSFKLALCFVMSGVSTMAQDTCSCRRLAVYPRVSWQIKLAFLLPKNSPSWHTSSQGHVVKKRCMRPTTLTTHGDKVGRGSKIYGELRPRDSVSPTAHNIRPSKASPWTSFVHKFERLSEDFRLGCPPR